MSVARDLGIGSTTLKRIADLATEYPENPFQGNGNARDVEMQCVLRENCRLRFDNEILTRPWVSSPTPKGDGQGY